MEFWIRQYIAMKENNYTLSMMPARHCFSSSTIDLMLATFEVKGAEIEAYVSDKDSPTSACLRA